MSEYSEWSYRGERTARLGALFGSDKRSPMEAG